MAVCKSAKITVRPIEAFGRRTGRRIGEVLRRFIYLGEERNECIERIGSEADPFDRRSLFGGIAADLGKRKEVVSVDADHAVFTGFADITVTAVGIVLRSLEMVGENVFDVLDGDLLFRKQTPRDIVAFRRVFRVRTVPVNRARIEVALDRPGTGSVIYMIRVAV